MGTRNLQFSPEASFDFKPDAAYVQNWLALPTPEIREVIGQTQSYLSFHQWLLQNVKNSNPNGGPVLSLIGHVNEGFLKTYILLSASVCEAALFDVLKDEYTKVISAGAIPPEELAACFTKSEEKFCQLSSLAVNLQHEGVGITTKIGYLVKKDKELKDYEMNFARFIDAGKAIDIYDQAMWDRLDQIRKSRNTIHLLTHANQVKTTAEKIIFMESECKDAADTVEALRVKITEYKK